MPKIRAGFSGILVAVCIAGTMAWPGRGDADPPFDSAINIQLFDYAIGPKTFVTVSEADVAANKQFTVDLLLTFLTNPYTIFNVTQNDDIINDRTRVVKNMLAGEVSGAYGFKNKYQLGLSLPLVLSMSGDGIIPAMATPDPNGLQASGVGDLRIEFKTRLLDTTRNGHRWRLAAAPVLTVPTSYGSDGNKFMGDNLPTFRAYGAAQWTDPSRKFSAAANLGVLFRKPREVYASEVGQQLLYGAAGAYKITQSVSAIAEIFGRGDLLALDLDAAALEVAGALRVRATRSFLVMAGVGSGLLKGIGSPDLRFFASVGWAPDFRDDDDDGISNMKDACPNDPEDKDGFEDSDGCPDDDNDGDRRADSQDKCPDTPEDFDGFQDEDGCPEADNDGDGLLDADDRCPVNAEDKIKPFDKDGCPISMSDVDDDGVTDDKDQCIEDMEDIDDFEDWDGCAEPDNDKDGIADADDRCPLCREDLDGFEDEDGCPELDNDGDGILDTDDKCPMEPEVINGVRDSDGCPDTGGKQVATLEGDRLTYVGTIPFRKSNLGSASKNILPYVAAVMRSHPEVIKWRIVVVSVRSGTETESKIVAQARAQAVKNALVDAGVSVDRLEAIGTAADAELVAFGVAERAPTEVNGEPICPAGFLVTPRQPPGAGSTPLASIPAEPAPVAPVEDPDRDGDGVADFADNCPDEPGTEDNQGCKKKQLVKITATGIEILDVVYFASAKARIRSKSNGLLKNVASVLSAHPEIAKVRIEGHTDNVGDPAKNLALSQARAEAVMEFLVKQKVAPERLEAKGFGDTVPIADNNTKDGQAANRRVEFKIVGE